MNKAHVEVFKISREEVFANHNQMNLIKNRVDYYWKVLINLRFDKENLTVKTTSDISSNQFLFQLLAPIKFFSLFFPLSITQRVRTYWMFLNCFNQLRLSEVDLSVLLLQLTCLVIFICANIGLRDSFMKFYQQHFSCPPTIKNLVFKKVLYVSACIENV